MKIYRVFPALFLLSAAAMAQSVPPALNQALERWKSAVAVADTASIFALYSTQPVAHVISPDGKQQLPVSDETNFWTNTHAAGARTVEVQSIREQQGLQIAALEVSFREQTPKGLRQRYVLEQQAWQLQLTGWRIVANNRSPVMKMRPPRKLNPHLYETDADARVDIGQALKKAAAEHKRVILVFGGNWCYDCHVLETALHEPDVAPAARHFEFVHVDIGDDGKKNGDLVRKYRVPIERGVPALAVLSDTGALLYSDQHGEFEKARSMDPDDVITFLNKWKATSK